MTFGSPGIFRRDIEEEKFCAEFVRESKDLCIKKVTKFNEESRKGNISDIVHGLGSVAVAGVVFTLVSMSIRKMLKWKDEVIFTTKTE